MNTSSVGLSESSGLLVYARGGEGNLPVRVITLEGGRTRRYELFRPGAQEPEVFTSSRSLLVSLTGHPNARNWTFDRYFRQGKHAPPSARLIGKPDPSVWGSFEGGPVIKVPSARPDGVTVLGIDLERRGGEVAKLLFAGFGHWIHSAGYDPQEVLQEVYKGILARNEGKCPWDARKSSFGHYVHMVCRGVLSNYHRKVGRERGHEQSGLGVIEDGGFEIVDVSEANVEAPETSERMAFELGDAMRGLDQFLRGRLDATSAEGRMARRLLPLIVQGMDRGEMADVLGVSKGTVAKGLSYLRDATRAWHDF